MAQELATKYDPKSFEDKVYSTWMTSGAFAATPDNRDNKYVVMMPLPNVTGALHMGHAMDNLMQDLLIRWHRMQGENTLWMAGTDHAGIATQAVVEKRLFELEGKTRHDIGREALVKRIWEWKEQYQKRIIAQQQKMGCSCDWERYRFTMDEVCARAVRHTFFRMFQDGLIYRGDRLVNWDCHLQTAVSDDEIVHEAVDGHFWHLRYPIIDPQPGEPAFVQVATTRPETMLGDTAVACHPNPEKAMNRVIDEAKEKLSKAGAKEKPGLEKELARLEERMTTHLPDLLKFCEMAKAGRKVLLPLQNRPIPLICDEWAKPELGSGCVKITPAHDPNDNEVWKRHEDHIELINILNEDGTLNKNAGAYVGLDRFKARKKVVADLDAKGLLEQVEDRKIEVGHSDRSKTPIEPYMSKQWFVHMGDVPGGITCARATKQEFKTPGLAQAAMDAVEGSWKSATGKKLKFFPDDRYARTYTNWLREKRDWCISRQLWWGHRIPIWAIALKSSDVSSHYQQLKEANLLEQETVCVRLGSEDGQQTILNATKAPAISDPEQKYEILICLLDPTAEEAFGNTLEGLGYKQDPDVLDTWFSSGLWPHSTLGWPNPETAVIEKGQSPLSAQDGAEDCLSYYYPGACLITGRDIITLWVARMVIMGLYNIGDLPFSSCFIHANILDGKGVRMSKSKGNGIDPVDIIERYGTDSMRYVLCEMQTGSQDIRLPVQAISPFTGKEIDLGKAKHGSSMYTYLCPETGKEFDVLGTMKDVPAAKLVSSRFEIGRNFCNKLWNASRFAFMNLEGTTFESRSMDTLKDEDRWILSRMTRAIEAVHSELENYNPANAIAEAREFFWSDLCDWYLEFIKPRMLDKEAAPLAQQVLATVIDQTFRLLHPFVPFITESLWETLNEMVPTRGIDKELKGTSEALIQAPWPTPRQEWRDETLETRMAFIQEVVRVIRDVRANYTIPPKEKLVASIKATGQQAEDLKLGLHLIEQMAGLERLEINPDAVRAKDAAAAVAGELEIFVNGVVDLEKERLRLGKQCEQIQKGITGAQRKLSNEQFTSRAKPEVVERERERLKEMEAQLERLEKNIEGLKE